MVQGRRRVRPARLLLLAGVGGLAWAALTLLSPASASADDGGDRSGGLLGTVSSTLSSVGDTVGATVGAVDSVVTSVTSVVVPVAAPVVAPVPAPVAQPVAEVVHAAPAVVGGVVGAVDAVATGAVDGAAQGVADLAGSAPVGTIVEPVADIVTDASVVGDLSDALGLDQVLITTAEALDGAVATVVGTPAPVGSVLPVPPLTSLDPVAELLDGAAATLPELPQIPGIPGVSGTLTPALALSESRTAALADRSATLLVPAPQGRTASSAWSATAMAQETAAGALAVAITVSGAGDGAPTALPGAGTASGSASGQSAGGGSAALGHEDFHTTARGPIGSAHLDDDALPGAPVFDTDVAPD
jgi:hypothetical protein